MEIIQDYQAGIGPGWRGKNHPIPVLNQCPDNKLTSRSMKANVCLRRKVLAYKDFFPKHAFW